MSFPNILNSKFKTAKIKIKLDVNQYSFIALRHSRYHKVIHRVAG